MSKGEATRERILDHAMRVASRQGLEGLSIGGLASELRLSKSGLFAHFGSKEDLQVAVLGVAAARFEDTVLKVAFRVPRGVGRIRKLIELWMRWATDPAVPGGCVFMAAAAELDDKPCKARDFLVGAQKQLLDAIARSARLAIEAGDFRKDVDCEQFSFELYAIMLGFNHAKRLMHDANAEKRAKVAFQRLVDSALKGH